MMRSEAITIIKRGLGFRQTQDAAIVSALQIAQRDLEHGKTLPDWLLAYDEPITVVAGTATVATPTGFLRLHDEHALYYLSVPEGLRVAIPRRNPEEAYDAYGGVEWDDSDYPAVMVLRGNSTIAFVPTPQTSFTAYLTYYKGAEVLTSEMENAWLANAPNYLIGMAGMNVASDLRDAGALQKFTAMARLGGQGYLGDIIETELAGRPLIMGRNN